MASTLPLKLPLGEKLKELLVASAIIALSILNSSCATTLTRGMMNDEEASELGVYKSTKLDLILSGGFFYGMFSDEVEPEARAFAWIFFPIAVVPIADLPISIVTDTILLPFDLAEKTQTKAETDKVGTLQMGSVEKNSPNHLSGPRPSIGKIPRVRKRLISFVP
jgi:uncharacterized protein YceK